MDLFSRKITDLAIGDQFTVIGAEDERVYQIYSTNPGRVRYFDVNVPEGISIYGPTNNWIYSWIPLHGIRFVRLTENKVAPKNLRFSFP